MITAVAFGVTVTMNGLSGLESLSWIAGILALEVAVIALATTWPAPRRHPAPTPRGRTAAAGSRGPHGVADAEQSTDRPPTPKYHTVVTDSRNVQIGEGNTMNIEDPGDGARGGRSPGGR
ncbi:hypothetical protein GCM10010517_12130 [Streptosporangium fragile]|uniref:Uncharacterized protein n=1 Tax=Streptosporangium fragile TaxID=46186 RepID=A0ABP6IAL3_9ACTN